MFCDELHLKVVAGKGGDGCASFRREKFIAKGGPDGGDGGNGGNIIFKINPQLNTLSHLTAKKIYKASRGEHGKGKKMHGKNAPDLILEVPPGTLLYSAENKKKGAILYDLKEEGESCLIAKGGKGGMGNTRFKTSTHQAPKFAENGEPGEEKEIILELKMVADLGLIGLPSSGKSTLISTISNARPKVAEYHFTTLIPNLGYVNMQKFGGASEESFVVADIPGLIEGASEGKGLGHQFLKHITRTKVLAHIIDPTLEKPLENYQTIRKELGKFDQKLLKKPEIIVINKSDLIEKKNTISKTFQKHFKNQKIHLISAIHKENIKEFLYHVWELIQKVRISEKNNEQEELEKKKTKPILLEPHLDKIKFEITEITQEATHKIFKISGKRLEQITIMTDIGNQEGLERIYRHIEQIGLQKILLKKGATLGDKISIKGKNIPFRP